MQADWLALAAIATLFITAISLAIATEYIGFVRFRRLLRRPCAGFRWHRAFPGMPHGEIRVYLGILAHAFGLRAEQGCYFRPDDRVMEIYSARYLPHLTLDDCLELETFAEGVELAYGVNIEKLWRDDITLGEIFKQTRPT